MLSSHRPFFLIALAVIGVGAGTRSATGTQGQPSGANIDPVILKSLLWRSIGPPRGGRSIAASGVKGRPAEAYFGAVGGGLWKTTDGGENWAAVTDGQINSSSVGAVAVTHVIADPKDANTVYALNTAAFKSTDGGKTLTNIGGGTHGHHHDLWIDPDNPQHLVIGNDGGGAVSMKGGPGWRAQDFPTPQYYHIATTKHVPYHVCGAQQDGSTVCLPSDTNLAGGRGGAADRRPPTASADPSRACSRCWQRSFRRSTRRRRASNSRL